MQVPIQRGSELDPRVWPKVLKRASALPLILGDAPWRGTIFRNNKMETGARILAIQLACYMLGVGGVDREKLLAHYRGHLDDDMAKLPPCL